MKTVEITLAMQLVLELMDDIGFKGRPKQLGNMFKKELDKLVEENYNCMYQDNPKLTINLLNSKHRLISQIAQLDEADVAILSQVVNDFIENIETFRENKAINITELL